MSFKARCHRCQIYKTYQRPRGMSPEVVLKLAGWIQDSQYYWICKKCQKKKKQ